MSAEIKDALEKILLEAVPYKHSSQELFCFCPMRGATADGRLMLVGRALYGWQDAFRISEMAVETARAKLLENTIAFSSKEDPIRHLYDGWEENRRKRLKKCYNPARSSFWHVAKEVLKKFSTPEESQNLLSYLYWTNLYKLSCFPIGNPGGSLQKIQRVACQEMLKTEINLLAPQRILFLTGEWWAEPFLNTLNYNAQECGVDSHVHQTGFLNLDSGIRCSIVVADHPERKKREDVVRDILAAFDKLSLLKTGEPIQKLN